jgi:hypothetical protein
LFGIDVLANSDWVPSAVTIRLTLDEVVSGENGYSFE